MTSLLRPESWRSGASISLALAAAVGLAACKAASGADDPRNQAQLVEAAEVQPAEASANGFTGLVAARVESNLGFRVAGKVVARLVDAGQTVRRGQPLMRIDPTRSR